MMDYLFLKTSLFYIWMQIFFVAIISFRLFFWNLVLLSNMGKLTFFTSLNCMGHSISLLSTFLLLEVLCSSLKKPGNIWASFLTTNSHLEINMISIPTKWFLLSNVWSCLAIHQEVSTLFKKEDSIDIALYLSYYMIFCCGTTTKHPITTTSTS